MRVAFDLDNTLIRCGYDFELETPRYQLWAHLLGGERLRRGIREVCTYCHLQGWEVWVYTTSYRSAWRIRRLFWLYGIRLNGVINQQRHIREVQVGCSKHPPTFGIDLLLDDSPGVHREGEQYGFKVLVVDPRDAQWVERVKATVQVT